ncbi:MAG: threonine-phosphate decarboxylase [Clostridia bacterium]|nr:threonine-phosphate decarboxylase [Clostridia bacterium]
MKKHGGNVFAFAKEHKISLDQVIDFSANINPLGLVDGLKKHLIEKETAWLNYPDPNYCDLRKTIADFEGVESQEVVVGNGAIECLFLIAETLKPKKVLIQAPTFIEYERAFKKVGSEIEFMKLNHEDFIPNLQAIDPTNYDTIIICNPNNPTGILIHKSSLIQMIKRCKKTQTFVLIDEAFIDFLVDEKEYSLVSELKEHQNLIILKSLTKFFAVPGLRLGYLLTSSKEIVDNIEEYRIPWTINGLAVETGQYVLRQERYIEETKIFIQSEREWLTTALKKIRYLKVFDSCVNYIFFYSEISNLHELLFPYHIMIRDCSNYENLYKGYYRIAVKNRTNNEILIQALHEIENQRSDYGNY